jgi:hypothetical protein
MVQEELRFCCCFCCSYCCCCCMISNDTEFRRHLFLTKFPELSRRFFIFFSQGNTFCLLLSEFKLHFQLDCNIFFFQGSTSCLLLFEFLLRRISLSLLPFLLPLSIKEGLLEVGLFRRIKFDCIHWRVRRFLGGRRFLRRFLRRFCIRFLGGRRFLRRFCIWFLLEGQRFLRRFCIRFLLGGRFLGRQFLGGQFIESVREVSAHQVVLNIRLHIHGVSLIVWCHALRPYMTTLASNIRVIPTCVKHRGDAESLTSMVCKVLPIFELIHFSDLLHSFSHGVLAHVFSGIRKVLLLRGFVFGEQILSCWVSEDSPLLLCGAAVTKALEHLVRAELVSFLFSHVYIRLISGSPYRMCETE